MEDNKADVFLVQEAIAAHDIHAELDVITDGEQAMKRIEEASMLDPLPDLFILDLNLPKRNGHEILGRIREKAEYVRTPVLIMTSSDSERDRQEATRLGGSGYFRKPSRFEEFLEIGALIRSLIAGQS